MCELLETIKDIEFIVFAVYGLFVVRKCHKIAIDTDEIWKRMREQLKHGTGGPSVSKDSIDRAKLLDAFEDADTDVMADYGYEYGNECGFSRCAVRDIINNAPTIDAVPVTRCRECK